MEMNESLLKLKIQELQLKVEGLEESLQQAELTVDEVKLLISYVRTNHVQDGKWVKIKWYQFGKWIELGKTVFQFVKKVMGLWGIQMPEPFKKK